MNSPKEKWKLKGVIYDCDGVLFDSFEANKKLYNDLCSLAGRRPLEEGEARYVHSHTVHEALHRIFGNEDGLEKKAIELLQKQVDLRDYIRFLKMEPCLFQMLNLLKAHGIKRIINTNRTTSMKHVLERFGLSPFFEMVVTALDVKNPKPDPESVLKILEFFNFQKEDVVFIGDSEVDEQTAESSGVKFIAYRNGELRGGAHIENHLDLLSFIF